jgi:hypothetical protein
MGMECSMNGREEETTEFWQERQEERDHLEDLDVGGRVIH